MPLACVSFSCCCTQRRNPLLCILNLKDENFRTKFVWTPPSSPAASASASSSSSSSGSAQALDSAALSAITEASVQQFVVDYAQNKLKPYLKSAERPPHDRDPTDARSTLCTVVSESFEELVMDDKR
jgi:hypothetical protein